MSSDGRYSNKLHSLVIGSPAVGKKLLTKAALTLNHVGFELPSTSKKITYAGLVGSINSSKGIIKSEPGYFPLATGGIICIQDYHELTKNRSTSFSDLFSKVMEDGIAIDSTRAKAEHQAIISLHIDMNRMSHVRLNDGQDVGYSDINIPVNVLSRFDFIIEIPPDLDRQLNVVSEMAKGSRILSTANLESETPQWQRDLKVIIAYVQTHFTMVEINERNNRYISSKLNNLFNKYTEDYERKILSSLATRIQISIEKLCKAIATSELRTIVTRDNINEAFEYVETKVDFLIEFSKSATPQLRAQTLDKKIERQNLILNFSTNEELSVPIIKDLLKGQGNTVNEKTIRRDLDELENSGKVEKIRQGRWKIANVQMSKCPSGAYKS
jgi:DNA replicative helicase MCM subunit Mcm2 (Cdc46/Mcm family)